MTRLLLRSEEGDRAALDQLLPLVYEELRRLAGSYMRPERAGHTLQPTGLVHEAYLRLVGQDRARWKGRQHFFRVAAQMMRRVLVDHSRGKKAVKRGGDAIVVTLADGLGARSAEGPRPIDVLALDRALETLTELDPRQAEIVGLRFFAGLTVEETARVLEISTPTVKREWAHARAWLLVTLDESSTEESSTEEASTDGGSPGHGA